MRGIEPQIWKGHAYMAQGGTGVHLSPSKEASVQGGGAVWWQLRCGHVGCQVCSLQPVRCALLACRFALSGLQVCAPGLCQVCSPRPVTCGHSPPASRTSWVALLWHPVRASGQQPWRVLCCTVFLRPWLCPVESVGMWSCVPSVRLALLHLWAVARTGTSTSIWPHDGHVFPWRLPQQVPQRLWLSHRTVSPVLALGIEMRV